MLLVSPTECWHLHVLSIGLVTMLMTTRVKLSISCKNIKKIFMVFDTCYSVQKFLFLFQTLFVCRSFVCPQANPKSGSVCTSFSCPIMNIHLILCLNESYSVSHREDIRSYFTSTMQFICWTNIFQDIFLVRKKYKNISKIFR